MSLLTQLVSHWELDETSGNTRDDDHGSNQMAEAGATPLGDTGELILGAVRSCSFGADDYLEKTSPVGIDSGAGSFTVGGWIKPSNVTGNKTLIGRFLSTGDQRGWLLSLQAAVLKFDVSSDGVDDFNVGTTSISSGVETFVVAWYDGGDNTIKIQVNNDTLVSAAGPASVFTSSTSLKIGFSFVGSNWFFQGEMQGFFYFSRVLSVAERTRIHNSEDGLLFSEWASSNPAAALRPGGHLRDRARENKRRNESLTALHRRPISTPIFRNPHRSR